MKRLAIIFVLIFILMAAAAAACAREEPYTNESSTGIMEVTTTKEPETTSPDIIEGSPENRVSEIKRIVAKLCGNEEYRFYAENSLGKGLQNEIISMADIVADRIKRDDLMGFKRSVNDDDISEYSMIMARSLFLLSQ